MFAQNIMIAGQSFLDKPMTPFMPTWNRVVSALPNILDELKDAVSDRQEFMQQEKVSGNSF